MDKIYCINIRDRDLLGKYFLRKGVEFAVKQSYGKAYEFLKEGLDIVTCDCLWKGSGWLESYANSEIKSFPDINFTHNPTYEFYFVKAYILSFQKDIKELYIGLDAIEKYLREMEDDYGYYVKGLIHNALEQPKAALECFQQGLEFITSSRLLYRIGRTKEQFLNENGLEELYRSFVLNPSSGCCCRNLKTYFKERGYSLELGSEEKNSLLLSFNESNDVWKFQEQFDEIAFLDNTKFGESSSNGNSENTFRTFLSVIKANSHLFFTKEESDYDHYEEYDSNDDYGSSYDEYGGYNDWDDDTINEAFDGDPEATWNVE